MNIVKFSDIRDTDKNDNFQLSPKTGSNLSAIGSAADTAFGFIGQAVDAGKSQLGDLNYQVNDYNTFNDLLSASTQYLDTSSINRPDPKKQTVTALGDIAAGAAAGSAINVPWGTIAGAVAGLGAGIASGVSQNISYRNDMMKANRYNVNQSNLNNQTMNTAMNNITNKNYLNQKFAEGGEINQFNVGGSHEENPNGGIPQGYGDNGQQNLVEEGEVKVSLPSIGDVILSDRVVLSPQIAQKFQIGKPHNNETVASFANRIINSFKDRVDPYSNQTKNTLLTRVYEAQEEQKLTDQASEHGMSLDEYKQALYEQQMNNQQQYSDYSTGSDDQAAMIQQLAQDYGVSPEDIIQLLAEEQSNQTSEYKKGGRINSKRKTTNTSLNNNTEVSEPFYNTMTDRYQTPQVVVTPDGKPVGYYKNIDNGEIRQSRKKLHKDILQKTEEKPVLYNTALNLQRAKNVALDSPVTDVLPGIGDAKGLVYYPIQTWKNTHRPGLTLASTALGAAAVVPGVPANAANIVHSRGFGNFLRATGNMFFGATRPANKKAMHRAIVDVEGGTAEKISQAQKVYDEASIKTTDAQSKVDGISKKIDDLTNKLSRARKDNTKAKYTEDLTKAKQKQTELNGALSEAHINQSNAESALTKAKEEKIFSSEVIDRYNQIMKQDYPNRFKTNPTGELKDLYKQNKLELSDKTKWYQDKFGYNRFGNAFGIAAEIAPWITYPNLINRGFSEVQQYSDDVDAVNNFQFQYQPEDLNAVQEDLNSINGNTTNDTLQSKQTKALGGPLYYGVPYDDYLLERSHIRLNPNLLAVGGPYNPKLPLDEFNSLNDNKEVFYKNPRNTTSNSYNYLRNIYKVSNEDVLPNNEGVSPRTSLNIQSNTTNPYQPQDEFSWDDALKSFEWDDEFPNEYLDEEQPPVLKHKQRDKDKNKQLYEDLSRAAGVYNPLRFAKLFDSAQALLTQKSPDYTYANNLASLYTPIEYNAVGNQAVYNPIDQYDFVNNAIASRNAAINQARSTSGGNASLYNAALNQINNSYTNGLASLAAMASRQNSDNYNKILQLNNQLALHNKANQNAIESQNNQLKAEILGKAYAAREQERMNIENAIYGNRNALVDEASKIGQEISNTTLVNNNPALLYNAWGQYKQWLQDNGKQDNAESFLEYSEGK